MLELNTEPAQAIEVLRGPSNSLYGSSAVRGAVNVLQAALAELPSFAVGLEAGPDTYGRVKTRRSHGG